MSHFLLKETIILLKKPYAVLVPYIGTPYALHKHTKFYKLINKPKFTHNNNYFFISNIEAKKSLDYYNDIASEISEREMYGNVIIYSKNYYPLSFKK